jgi:hypothetical protein
LDDAEASPGSRASAAVVSIAAPQGRQEREAITTAGQGGAPSTGQAPQPGAPVTSFDRRELNSILKVYGRKVAEGEWRDYAIDFRRDEAVFSIFRRASEMPLFRIVKDMRLARRQGAYSVVAAGGMILKRGSDLERVLAVLDRKRGLRLVEA